MQRTKYIYKNPEDDGFVLTGITMSELYKLGMAKRGNPFTTKAEVYYKEGFGFKIYFFNRWFIKIVALLLLPVTYLVHGIGNYRQINKEVKGLIQQKKYGCFRSDHCDSRSKMYPGMIKLLNSKLK